MKQSILQRLKMAFIFWLARRLPDCKTITPTIGESLDRRLSLREKIVMRLHLFTCEACANYLKEIKFLREVVQIREEKMTRDDDFPAAKLNSDAKERIRNALRASGNPSL